jgi:hypothetical protein
MLHNTPAALWLWQPASCPSWQLSHVTLDNGGSGSSSSCNCWGNLSSACLLHNFISCRWQHHGLQAVPSRWVAAVSSAQCAASAVAALRRQQQGRQLVAGFQKFLRMCHSQHSAWFAEASLNTAFACFECNAILACIGCSSCRGVMSKSNRKLRTAAAAAAAAGLTTVQAASTAYSHCGKQ